MKNPLLEEAIKYTERGWFVFPTREVPSKPFMAKMKSGGMKEIILPLKSPYNKGGFSNATRDVEQLKIWWRKYPQAGIGISCGHSNLVVVDIDVRNGKNGFENFMKMNISDEGALHSMTPSGGLHIIYSGKMNSHANVKCGVDLRSSGAYIVAPPSYIFEEGKKLSYVKLDDWDREPITVPISLEEKLNELRGKIGTSEKKEKTSVPDEPITKTVNRVKLALEKLPFHMCEDYFEWVNIGMALKSLGDDGFNLWDEWSRKSSKYDRDALEYRWERFDPREITIASIFHYAKEATK